jgi:hypothetical protein
VARIAAIITAIDSLVGPWALSLRNCTMAAHMRPQVNLIFWIRHIRATSCCIVNLMIAVSLLVFVDYKCWHLLLLLPCGLTCLTFLLIQLLLAHNIKITGLCTMMLFALEYIFLWAARSSIFSGISCLWTMLIGSKLENYRYRVSVRCRLHLC